MGTLPSPVDRGGGSVTRGEALRLIDTMVPQQNLRKHMLACEAVMRALARRLGDDEEAWGMAGLLHDVDYADTADAPDIHGLRSAEILREHAVPEQIVHAVLAHANKADRTTPMSRAMYAADPLTGFLVACALMTNDKSLAALDVPFCLRRFGEKAFARGASRDQMETCMDLGLTLEEFMTVGITAMQEIAGDIGL